MYKQSAWALARVKTAEKRRRKNQKSRTPFFGDVLDLSGYERSISNTRKWLYMIAAIWFIWGIINFNKMPDQRIAWFILAEYVFVSLSFLAFAVWSRRKASGAFLAAIAFYVLLNGLLYYNGALSLQNILLRVVIIISVVKGYFDARKYEELKLTVDFTEEDS